MEGCISTETISQAILKRKTPKKYNLSAGNLASKKKEEIKEEMEI